MYLIITLYLLVIMAATIVRKCNCESKFQDERYGKGMRLMNLKDPGKHKNEAVCTVCGTKHNI